VNPFKRLHLWVRMTTRFGAYKHARGHGSSDEQALAYMDYHFPPTADDLSYVQELRRKSRLPKSRTPWPFVWAVALGWGAFLGYQHEGLLQFLVVASSLGAITLWWERKQQIRSYIEAFVVFTVWFGIVMALAYWPVLLLLG
jgi:hypothetical protein